MAETQNTRRGSSQVLDHNGIAAAGAAKSATRPHLKSGLSNPNMNGPLYMQTSNSSNVVLVPRLKRKQESTWRQMSRWFVENQIGML